MKKKSVNLVTAVGVLVILSGAYVGVKTYVAKQEETESQSEEEDESQEILSLASDDIKSIKFVIDKKEVTFEKDGDTWIKSDESAFPVDQDKIDDLASAFSSVTAARTLENVEDPSEYELDQPENTITVTTNDGESTVIRLGMENDSTNQEYIDLNKDSSTVYVVSNSTFSSFEGTLYDFAKSGTFPTIDSSTVSKITVNENSGSNPASYVVEKDANNFWNVTGEANGDGENGKTEKADSAKATSLASALSSMAYSSYVNYNCEDNELSQYGLDKPYAEIVADYQEEVEIQKDENENEITADGETDAENANEGQESALSAADEEDAADEANGAEKGAEDVTEASEDGDKETVTEGDDESTEEVTKIADTAEKNAEEVTEEAGESDQDVEETTETADTEEKNAEEDAEDETETSDDTEGDTSEEDEEPTTEMVDRELTILVGDQAPDGGRYVKVNDSKEIYTISEDSLDTFISKSNEDFWDLTVSYVSVNNLESLDVDYKGDTYTVDVSRETSEEETDTQGDDAENTGETLTDDSEAEGDSADTSTDSASDTSSTAAASATVTLSYQLNGNDLDSTTFTTYYNKLINMVAQKRLTDKFETKADPEMEVAFNTTDGTQEAVSYYSYDTNYYAAVAGEKVYLVNKMNVKEMFTAFENVAGITSETADSEGEAASDDGAETETTEE